MRTVLRVQQLGHRAGARWLIRNAAFDLHEGFTALVGPNGAGKSTLLRTMAGLLSVDQGRLLGDSAANAVGYVPQFPGIYLRLTPTQYLVRTAWWDARAHRAPWPERRAREVLERLNLTSVADRPGHTLTLGERRRLALASLWMRQVPVILLDEPTAGLDPDERLAFWQELYQLRQLPASPEAYLVTTHLLDEVERYCDEVILLDRGQVRGQFAVSSFQQKAQGHAFFAPQMARHSPYIDTGRLSDEGFWVVAEKPSASLVARPPDVVDAYLWMLHQIRRKAGGKP